MKTTIALLTLSATTIMAAPENLLNIAILQLPEQYLAGIPMARRAELISNLSRNAADTRLDYANGWLGYANDNPYRSVGANSLFWIKLLPRKDREPLVFIHIPNRSENSAPPKSVTAILERRGDKWENVTESLLPDGVNATDCFVPRRNAAVIQIAPFVQAERSDGRGKYWADGQRTGELRWDGRKFEFSKTRPAKLTYD
ncbi:MAG: hypothetical protein RL088_3800 [Verrucomicrobiota bacterium]|jgi:hypothetical protein